MPNLFSKYFEKIFGNKHDIVQYTYKYLSDLLIKYETSIKQDIINYYIQNFKKEKMKLKISESKKEDINYR